MPVDPRMIIVAVSAFQFVGSFARDFPWNIADASFNAVVWVCAVSLLVEARHG